MLEMLRSDAASFSTTGPTPLSYESVNVVSAAKIQKTRRRFANAQMPIFGLTALAGRTRNTPANGKIL
jgi:hypothetical protein